MEPIYQKPMDIEARSMAIIEEHLTGVTLPEPERSILKRVIHICAFRKMPCRLHWKPCKGEHTL